MYWIYTCTLMVFHFFYDALENSNYDCLEWCCVSALHQTFPNPFCFSAASPSLVAPWFQTKTIPLGLLLSSCIRPAVTRPSQWGLCLQVAYRDCIDGPGCTRSWSRANPRRAVPSPFITWPGNQGCQYHEMANSPLGHDLPSIWTYR